jgi:hypothetical protein
MERPASQPPRSIGLRFAAAAAAATAVIVILFATDTPEQIEAKIIAGYISRGPPPSGRAVGVTGIEIPLLGGVGIIHSALNFEEIVTAAHYAGAIGVTVILDCLPVFVLATVAAVGAKVKRTSSAPDSAASSAKRRHAPPDVIRRVHELADAHPDWSDGKVLKELSAALKDGERAPSRSTVRMYRKRGSKRNRHSRRALSDEHEQVLVDWLVGRSVSE